MPFIENAKITPGLETNITLTQSGQVSVKLTPSVTVSMFAARFSLLLQTGDQNRVNNYQPKRLNPLSIAPCETKKLHPKINL